MTSESTHPRPGPSASSGGRAGIRAIGLLVRRSLRQHALSTAVTVFSVALACGLVMAIFVIRAQAEAAFAGGACGFDAVLGPRGSRLQIVLNAIYHLESSPGNIPWSTYENVSDIAGVKLAIPYAVGDNYLGARIVGTIPEALTEVEYRPGRKPEVETGGRLFDPTRREAVVGAEAARRTGLTYGAKFHPSHGVEAGPDSHAHEETYVVVGVLQPTNTPMDRVIYIPLEGILRMSGHVLRHEGDMYAAQPGEEVPDEFRQVSAILLKFAGPQVGLDLDERFNKQGTEATLAWPVGAVMTEMFDKLGWMVRILTVVAYLVVVVAASAILAGVHNTINERRRDFAILRALGARRATVFSVIAAEAGTIALCGATAGFAVYAVVLFVAATVIRDQTGVVIDATAWHAALAWTPLGMLGLGVLAGLIPAVKAYSTDVAGNLAPQA